MRTLFPKIAFDLIESKKYMTEFLTRPTGLTALKNYFHKFLLKQKAKPRIKYTDGITKIL